MKKFRSIKIFLPFFLIFYSDNLRIFYFIYMFFFKNTKSSKNYSYIIFSVQINLYFLTLHSSPMTHSTNSEKWILQPHFLRSYFPKDSHSHPLIFLSFKLTQVCLLNLVPRFRIQAKVGEKIASCV